MIQRSQLPAFRVFLFQLVLTIIIALPVESFAQRGGRGGGRGGNGPHNRPNRPQRPLPPMPAPQYQQVETIKAHINQHFRGFNILPVRKTLKQYTGIQQKGKKLKKIVIKASSMRGFAQAQLLINGQAVGYPQTIPMYTEKLVFQVANQMYGPSILGQDIGKVQIELKGNVTVKMVAMKVKQNQFGHMSKTFQVHQTLRGEQRIRLAQLIGPQIRNLAHKQVKSIVLTVSSARGHGSVIVAGGGQVLANFIAPMYQTSQLIRLPWGASLQSLKIRTRGMITIKSVKVNLQQNNW